MQLLPVWKQCKTDKCIKFAAEKLLQTHKIVSEREREETKENHK